MNNLYSKILGKGDKHLIILHGFLGMSDNWKTHGNIFAKNGFKVHLLDQRNHGRSFWDKEFNYDVLAEDLFIYMDEQNIKNSVLIGHSMGGKTAMEFSFKYPEKIKKLIIVDISPKKYISSHDKILAGLSSIDFKLVKTRKEVDNQLSKYVTEAQVRQFLLKNLYWISTGQLALRLNISILKNSSNEISRQIEIHKGFNKPVLFLKGENSDYILNEDMKVIKKYFLKSKIMIIRNSGHWMHVENQKDFINTIKIFLKF